MNSWLILLPIIGLFIALGSFLDKYHPDMRSAERARSFLISVYLAIETRATVGEAMNLMKSSRAVLPSLGFGTVFYVLPVAILYSIADEPPDLLIWLMIPILLTLAAMTLLAIAFMFIVTATACFWMCRIIAMQVLGRASDPKVSPFGYAFSFLGLLLAFAKAVADAVGYVT